MRRIVIVREVAVVQHRLHVHAEPPIASCDCGWLSAGRASKPDGKSLLRWQLEQYRDHLTPTESE